MIATIVQYSQQKLIFQKRTILLFFFSPLKVILMLKVIASADWKTLEEPGNLYIISSSIIHSSHQVDATQLSTNG